MATGASLSEEYYTGAFARNPDSLVIFVSNKERRGGEEEAVDAGDLFGAGGIRGGGLGAGDAMSGGGYGGGGLGGYGAGYGGGYNGYGGGGYFAGLDQPEMPPFARYMHVAHCMWAISFASCCGVLAARQRIARDS